MLEAAETGQSLDQETFDRLEPELRTELVHMQLGLKNASFPVIILVSGDDPEGARAVLNLYSEWMDPRFVQTYVYGDPTEEQRLRPLTWRFWQQLPTAGRVAVFGNDWETRLLMQRVKGNIGQRRFLQYARDAERLERMLAVDGAIILKLFLHMPMAELKRRSKQVHRMADWSAVAQIGKGMIKHPKRVREMTEELLQQTGTGLAPWHLIESVCPRYRDVTAARLLLDTVKARLAQVATPAQVAAVAGASEKASPGRSVLDAVDLTCGLTDEEYDREMSKLKKEVAKVTRQAHHKGISVVAAFEGWDAAGKGGVIRRLAQSMNPETYRIIPIAAPNDVERGHHYLWRFWRHLPRDGGFVIFDRTWYGRVLVERVEGFAKEEEWQRAYDEIDYFERQLVEHGMVVVKFWLHIDKDEQLRRFKAREEIPFKQYKIGPDDYRNREKWDQYVQAIDDMVARTSTPEAPWHLIPSNNKKYARVQVMREVVKAIKDRL